ncbi:MAG TPA: integrase core domain-containing protein [Ktedonobacteraceae bacterium]|nr:integrase core domain-containing protein [Ktedonobacteraceae bacterium]
MTNPTTNVHIEPVSEIMEGVERRRRWSPEEKLRIVEETDEPGRSTPYIAAQTRRFAAELGFSVRTTPVRSPQSNGMAEAFVKTFKRDYVEVNPAQEASTVLRHLAQWFEHYNENHPHKALKMRSPREYRRALLPHAA